MGLAGSKLTAEARDSGGSGKPSMTLRVVALHREEGAPRGSKASPVR